MHTQEKELSPKESLQLINNMIAEAKQSFMNFSFYFLMWGWLLFFAGIAEYCLQYIVQFEHSYIGWPIVGIVGGIIAGIKGAKEGQEAGGMGYIDRVFSFLWSGFVITLILLILSVTVQGGNPNAYVMLLTGLPTFVSGGVMKFKPLIIGGIMFWVIALVSVFLLPQYSALLFSLAIICGYIIPGYMLKKQENAV